MSARAMTLVILGLCLAVSQVPRDRELPAAASDAIRYVETPLPTLDVAPPVDSCPPQSEPMTVCTPAGCYRPPSNPEASVVEPAPRPARVPPSTAVRSAPLARPVFRGGEPFMQRGPARRAVLRVGRVTLAPMRWLCRR